MDAFPSRFRFSWKTTLSVLVSCGFLWAALRRVRGAELMTALAGADLGWLLAGLMFFGLGGLLAAARLHLMLSLTGGDVHPGATIRLAHIGRFFNLLLCGPVAGDLARSALYSRWFRMPLSRVIAAAPLDRLLGLAGLLILVGAGATISGAAGAFGGITGAWLLGGCVAAGGLAALVMGVARVLPGSPVGRVWGHFLDAVRTLWRHPRRALRGLFLGFLVQASMGAALAACFKAVNPESGALLRMVWVFPAITVLTSMPSVAGVGLREAAAMTLLGWYGISGSDAVAASLSFAGCYVCWAVFGGVWLWRETARMTKVSSRSAPRGISVVIPTWNEESALPETLRRLRAVPEVEEIIVADGGSSDQTATLAGEAGCRLVQTGAGRGKQIRAGAQVATGDVVLILHADTWAPPDAGAAVLRALRDPTVVGGGFWKEFRDGMWMMAGSRWRCATRLFLFRRILGDQGLFVRRNVLESVGGAPDMPLMEEFRMCELLNGAGRLALAGATVLTSARRFRKLGPARTYFRMWRVTILYYLGVRPETLKKMYEKD